MSNEDSKLQLQEKLDLLKQKEEAKQKRISLLAEENAKTIKKQDIYYVAETNQYIKRSVSTDGNNDKWVFVSPEAAEKVWRLNTREQKQVFDDVLNSLGRLKTATVMSFYKQPDDVLNLISRSDWIEPKSGQYHPIFDVLMQSLSDGRQSVQDHIEKVLVYKYLHPECYKLPCITISGEGGAGKNEFVEQVLSTIFGKQQIAVLGTDEAFGAFNGTMLGKTVVFIDEALVERTKAEQLKRRVGNETIQINMKYGMQGSYDNTPWYWIGGNGTNGAVMLSGSITDRRYSVLAVKYSVMHWIAKHLGHEEIGKDVLPSGHPCVEWYVKHCKNLSDREQVARWLGTLISKWGNQEYPPSALHEEDYQTSLHTQKSVFDDVMEFVFDERGFEHIEGSTLYKVYQLLHKADNPKGNLLGKVKFITNAKDWIEKRHPEIVWKRFNIRVSDSKATSATGFIAQTVSGYQMRNNDRYVVTLHDDKTGRVVEERLAERTFSVSDHLDSVAAD